MTHDIILLLFIVYMTTGNAVFIDQKIADASPRPHNEPE